MQRREFIDLDSFLSQGGAPLWGRVALAEQGRQS
jgi:hypothetical protein